jgi:chromosome segregation ATPase
MTKDKHQIKLLENRCEQALTKFNELRSQNKSLRKQIDTWRETLTNQQRVNKVYSREIDKQVKEILAYNTSCYNGQRFCQDTNDQILALKAKHEIDKFQFEHKILDLQEKLKERDDSELDQTKTKGIEVKDSSST